VDAASLLASLGGAAGIVSVLVALGSLIDKRRDARNAARNASALTMEKVAAEYEGMLDDERAEHSRTRDQRNACAEANAALLERAVTAEANARILAARVETLERAQVGPGRMPGTEAYG
jgi:uncharacterized protein (DUF488 family)